MYNFDCETIPPKTIRTTLSRDGKRMTWDDVLTAWEVDFEFRKFFNALIVESPFVAVRWETPGIASGDTNLPFEHVLIDAPRLDVRADARAFAEHFAAAGPAADAVAFESLGRDALLIAPSPLARYSAYSHLAAFCRKAPAAQVDALWRIVGESTRARLSPRPLYLNTAGGGVPWLHIRLDSRPKYYHHAPYK